MRRQMLRISEIAARPARTFTADLAQAEALAARARGDVTVEQWEAVVEERRAVGRPFEIATALADLAVTLVPARRREESGIGDRRGTRHRGRPRRPALRQALESIARRARIGLEGVDTAEDAADRLGLVRASARSCACSRMATNRQIGDQLFMAESTAGVHVSRILGKLGVTRRSEAAVAAHRLGLSRLS